MFNLNFRRQSEVLIAICNQLMEPVKTKHSQEIQHVSSHVMANARIQCSANCKHVALIRFNYETILNDRSTLMEMSKLKDNLASKREEKEAQRQQIQYQISRPDSSVKLKAPSTKLVETLDLYKIETEPKIALVKPEYQLKVHEDIVKRDYEVQIVHATKLDEGLLCLEKANDAPSSEGKTDFDFNPPDHCDSPQNGTTSLMM